MVHCYHFVYCALEGGGEGRGGGGGGELNEQHGIASTGMC